MRDEEKEWKKTLEESDALIRRSRECLQKAVARFLAKNGFLTPTDGSESEKKMFGNIL